MTIPTIAPRSAKRVLLLGSYLLLAVLGACGRSTETVAPPPPSGDQTGKKPSGGAGGSSVVVVAVGDVGSSSAAAATAKLIDSIPGPVILAGDLAYPSGSTTDFASFDKNYGRFKDRTHPAPGNHEYNTSGAGPYYTYYGASAGPSGRGYYSFDVGDWHLISLNSNIDMSAGSAQEKWLRADLAANSKTCTLAYWHHPRFSGGTHGSSTQSQPIWQALYDAGADVVVVGHDHDYQRFAPQTPNGQPDPQKGIREFVVGTGGAAHYSVTTIANLETSTGSTFGVLKLSLGSGRYSWEFIPVAGGSYHDSGSGTCH